MEGREWRIHGDGGWKGSGVKERNRRTGGCFVLVFLLPCCSWFDVRSSLGFVVVWRLQGSQVGGVYLGEKTDLVQGGKRAFDVVIKGSS